MAHTKQLLQIALPRGFDLPLITPAHSRAAPSYFRGSFCTMRNSLLQCCLTRRRSKQDRASGPKIQSLLVAVRAFEVMSIETGENSRHDLIPIESIGSG